ncbi:hypothetical protein K0U07_00340 [bacterium]|nr:hypothetical protein [bacterium]
MKLKVDQKIIENYPELCIGFLVVDVKVEEKNFIVEKYKEALLARDFSGKLDSCNFVLHPKIAKWRDIYREDFHVKPKTYRSSIEALMRRVITKKEIWNISSVVDLYNCCSAETLLPMGGYDLDKIKGGSISLRYGVEGEIFCPLGVREKIEVQNEHIVYADEEKVLCWLWNHKDSRYSSIDLDTKKAIFFIDNISKDLEGTSNAITLLSKRLEQIGGVVKEHGILHKDNLVQELKAFALK